MCRCVAIFSHSLSCSLCNTTRFHRQNSKRMDSNTFINAVFLCLVNVIFMIAGIFLNSVVIISLRRSSQLRKKLCYFMILPLSCFDLAVVAINHPIMILRTVLWSNQGVGNIIMKWTTVTISNLTGFSMSALLTLTVERFLALKYPFFHQTAVTKRKLVLFLAFFIVIIFSLSSLLYFDWKIYGIALAVVVLSFLSLFLYFNYNIFIIAKLKDKGRSTSTTGGQESKGLKLNLKQIFTCSIAVGCFFICFFPIVVNWILNFTSDRLLNDQLRRLFGLWSNTLLAMNSTFNCLIFFWRNSILRHEGMKTVKCFRSARS